MVDSYVDNYKRDLAKLIRDASQEAVTICRAWDKNFGIPGYGGIDYVASKLIQAQIAIVTLKALQNQ